MLFHPYAMQETNGEKTVIQIASPHASLAAYFLVCIYAVHRRTISAIKKENRSGDIGTQANAEPKAFCAGNGYKANMRESRGTVPLNTGLAYGVNNGNIWKSVIETG